MSAPTDDVALVITRDELQMLRHALHSYISDFGHDEADILRAAQHLLAKIDAEAAVAAH